MNPQLKSKVATIVEKYIPAAHFNERRKLGQDLSTLVEDSYNEGYAAHRDYVRSKGFWWRLFYVF